jgi:hypothetical protein
VEESILGGGVGVRFRAGEVERTRRGEKGAWVMGKCLGCRTEVLIIALRSGDRARRRVMKKMAGRWRLGEVLL